MVGLYLALRLIEACLEGSGGLDISELPVFIFSDSLGCICYITDTWPAPKDNELSRATRSLFQKLNASLKKLRLFWVKGHSNTSGNDIADALACVASNHVKLTQELDIISVVRPVNTSSIHRIIRQILFDITTKGWASSSGLFIPSPPPLSSLPLH
jgi:hypothetical protein